MRLNINNNMYKNKRDKKGFTLIELLVVIAIIGLLSSIVMASLNSARKKARDSRRIADLKQLQIALEMYYSDKGYYPHNGSNTYAGCWKLPNNWIPDGTNYDWSTSYISKQPQDPADICCWPWGNCGAAGDPGTYEYWSDGTKYLIAARLEITSSPYRAEVTGIIDPRSGQPYANLAPLGKYVFVLTN